MEDALDIRQPATLALPLVLASPHSGAEYPTDLLAASRLDPMSLRRSEDSFVDALFGAAPELGAPLLAARFPRAYLDVNREAYELDPTQKNAPLFIARAIQQQFKPGDMTPENIAAVPSPVASVRRAPPSRAYWA